VSIFKLKFEAHRLVNLLFYGVIFILGFVCGLGIKQIDFNKLIPKILMIENVNALTITTTVDTSNGNLIVFDEEYIYNEMFNNTEYSYEDYSNIICHYSYYVNSSSVGGITCRAFNSIDDFKITDYSSMNNRFTYSYPSKTLTYELTFNKSTGNILLKRVFINEIDAIQSSFAYFAGNDSTSDSSNKVYSNFNFINGSSLDTVNKKINKLNFDEYLTKLEFNENLFEKNEDFRKVCVDSNKSFAISRITTPTLNSKFDYDYIWFPYNLNNGLYRISYDSTVKSNEEHYSKEEAYLNYFFSSKEIINSFYSSDVPGTEFNLKGYTNKYSYYGWTAYPFFMYFDNDNEIDKFDIFSFDNPSKSYISSSGIIHGGAGITLDSENKVVKEELKYCFYLKKEYVVNIIQTDEYGDFFGTVDTPNGKIDIETSFNRDNFDTSTGFSVFTKFINDISDSINVAKDIIFDFYSNMPMILRMFILAVFILLLIKIIVGMVVK